MTSWPQPGHLLQYTDATTGATPLALMKQAIQNHDATVLDQLPDAFSLLMGDHSLGGGAGTIGEICGLALLAGFAFMLWRRIITWHIPVSIIVSAFAFSAVMHLINPIYADPTTVILSGGLLLGAIFMATDYVTSPMTPNGQIIYGISIGLLTIIIRNCGAYPEGMSFAILIMNAFTPLINSHFKPKRYGEEVKK
jgi:electron transport complex protein RnfD